MFRDLADRADVALHIQPAGQFAERAQCGRPRRVRVVEDAQEDVEILLCVTRGGDQMVEGRVTSSPASRPWRTAWAAIP